MSRPRSESGLILNWSSPDPNSDLGWTNLKLVWPNSELVWPRSKSLIIYHCKLKDFDLGQPKSKLGSGPAQF